MTIAPKNPAEQFAVHATPVRASSSKLANRFYVTAGKRLLDISLVLIAAPFILMVVMSLALVIALKGGRPFYLQDRVGRDGKIYRMWKLRSMVHNAEEALESYLAANPEARAEWDAHQKLVHDPRITAFGRLLRRTSLDELPQLWNVLRGDMSLVGPRPMLPEQVKLYPCTRYYDMRPGITGFWQVSARNASTFRDRAGFDAAYHEQMGLWTDVKLLFATVAVVFNATGH